MTTTQNSQTITETAENAQLLPQPGSMKGRRSEGFLKRRAGTTRLILEHPHLLVDIDALDAATGNKPLFTREVLEQAAADLDEARILDDYADPIYVPHVLGDGEWASEYYGPGMTIAFTRAYELANVMGEAPLYTIGPEDDLKDFLINNVFKPDDIETNPVRKALAAQPPYAPHLSEMVAMLQRIQASQAMEEIKKLLVASRVRIDNIVCLALGDPLVEGSTGRHENACGQHLLACAIADALVEHAKSASAIPIAAFDPEYDMETSRLLAHLPQPIHVVSSPYEYLSMTPNTLVICIGIPIFTPAYEIMADSLFPLGPAALMCIEFPDQPWHAEGLISIFDPLLPRVAKMLKQYEVNWLGDFVPKTKDGGLKELQWLRNVAWYSRKQ